MTLIEWMVKHQISKREFAAQIQIDESTLFKYINRQRVPRLDIAIRIFEASEGKVSYREMLAPGVLKPRVYVKLDGEEFL